MAGVDRVRGGRHQRRASPERAQQTPGDDFGVLDPKGALLVGGAQRGDDDYERVALVEFGLAGRSEHGGAVEHEDALHVGPRNRLEECVKSARELVQMVRRARRSRRQLCSHRPA